MRSGVKSKRKGGNFERKCARLLSLWWSEGSNPHVFWRTSSSGARASIRSLTFHRGDITNVDSEGEAFTKYFVVECKSYREIDFLYSLDFPYRGWYLWWKQCKRDADAIPCNPLLIMHRNRRGTYVVLYTKVWNELTTPPYNFPIITYDDLTIVPLERFFEYVSPSTIREKVPLR